MTGVKQDAREVNSFLDILENKVFKTRKELTEDDELITAELLRGMLTGQIIISIKTLNLKIMNSDQIILCRNPGN